MDIHSTCKNMQYYWSSREIMLFIGKKPKGRSIMISSTMGWLQLAGSLKVQVSFAEYRLFYRAPLQKRPIILRSLLIVATPDWSSGAGLAHSRCNQQVLTHKLLFFNKNSFQPKLYPQR